jgi:hypothetical protein
MNQIKEQKQQEKAVKTYEKVRKQFEKLTKPPSENQRKKPNFDGRSLQVWFQCGLKETGNKIDKRVGGYIIHNEEKSMRTIWERARLETGGQRKADEFKPITKFYINRVCLTEMIDGKRFEAKSKRIEWNDYSSGCNHWKYNPSNPLDKKWLDRLAEINYWDYIAMRAEEL